MIDNTECAWILNTDNSITPEEATASTKSPWILSEIATMQLIRRKDKDPQRYQAKVAAKLSNGRIDEQSVEIKYIVPLSSFSKIDVDTLMLWESSFSTPYPLDRLYELAPEY